MSTEFKGGTEAEGTGTPPAVGLPLHASAAIGDFVVIAGAGVDITDDRFTRVGIGETWAGVATSLADIEYTSVGFHWCVVAAVFTPSVLGESDSAVGSDVVGTLPQIQSLGIVIASLTGSAGPLGAPEDFTLAVDRDQGVTFASIWYLHVSGLSPAAQFDAGVTWTATVLTARFVTHAPPCRLYPRSDRLGVGSGRIFPPPKSHQYSPRRSGATYY